MPVIRCPSCSKPNPDFLENCQYCDTRLTPAAGAAADDTLIRAPGGTLRCQACGRSNPDTRENCQYCEARLRPLEAASDTSADADPLARLRSTQTYAEPTAPDAAEPAAPDPGTWMSRLRGVGAAGPGDETIVPGNRLAGEPEPDWMFNEAAQVEESLPWLRDEPPPPPDAPSGAGDELPPWLAGLQPAGEQAASEEPASQQPPPLEPAPPPAAPAAPTLPDAGDDDLPDWLKIEAPLPPPRHSLADRPRKGLTDWLNARPAETPPAEPPARNLPAPEAPAAEPPTTPSETPQPTDQTLVPPGRPRRKKMTDWLTPPEGGLPPAPPPKAAEPTEPEAELPDWLKAMQPSEEVPEWLRDAASAPRVFNRPAVPIEPPAATPPESAAPAAADLGLPDWLKESLPKTEPAASEPAPGEAAAPPAADVPAAMTEAPMPGAPAEEPEADANLPDWLKALRANPAPAPAADAPGLDPLPIARRQQELPEWLKGATGSLPPEPAAESEAPQPALGAVEPESAAEAIPLPEPPAADSTLPWLATVEEPETAAEAPAAQPGDYELPDWLRPSPEALAEAEAELAAEPPVDPAALSAAELAAAEEALPDWLRNIQARADEPPADDAVAAPESDIPAWLRPAGPPASPPEPVDTLPADETPDWLQAAQSQAASPTLPTANQAADLPPLDDETLAWLAAARAEEPAQVEPEAAGAPLPDWLSEYTTVSELPPAAGEMDAVPGAESELTAEPTAVEDMPDWLKALRGVPTQEQQAAEAMPDWLRGLRGIPPQVKAENTSTPTAPQPPTQPAPAPDEDQPQDAGQEEAALPAWLSAMRPTEVEHPANAEVDAYEENVGVLAGMRGVLRAEPTVAQPHRSTTPVHSLVVADHHAAQAKMLAGLVDESAAVSPAPARPARRWLPKLERWLVFLLLAAAILLPQFVLTGLFPAPTSIRPETQDAVDVVNSAAAGQPALVAFDFDPAEQGELGPGATAIITHLMTRGVPVVGVSTRPLGAAVAHSVLSQVAADLGARAGVSYTYGSQYLNLGYIPGGPVGVLQFAASPQSVFAADFTGAGPATALWTQPILREVDALADFSVVVLVTASPDEARAWIEQSQAYAPGGSRLAVVSAGAEPMVRPYLEGETPQLGGLVSGLAGAAQYEQYAGLPGQASRHWGALGGGLWAAALLIAGGNLIYAAAAALGRRRR